MDQPTTAASHRPRSEVEIIDLTSSMTTTVTSSPSPQLSTLYVTRWHRDNFIEFCKEKNISFHPDYSWKTFIWLVAKFIVEDREAEILQTDWKKLANADLAMTIHLSTAAACHRGFEILSHSRAFEGCDIQLRRS
ncbi:hypothetical protein HOY82DRAFT_609971 [Tuber indicum]|nr:hypothetical protein HOY82DRAFT_609971 [Tuber indicum]